MIDELGRREFLGSTALAATGAAVAMASGPRELHAQTASSPGKPPTTHEPKPLPFDPAKIKGISEKLLVSHHENNYAGAVKRLNDIEIQLAGLDWAATPAFVINGFKREQLIAANSMVLHELYFDGLGGEGGPAGALAEAITRDFGSFENWQTEFAAIGKALGGGSGWTLLFWSPHDRRLLNTWSADHAHTLAGGRPILALDMYEHAYQMDYGAKAAAYVDAFMQVIRWDNAGRLYEQYSKES